MYLFWARALWVIFPRRLHGICMRRWRLRDPCLKQVCCRHIDKWDLYLLLVVSNVPRNLAVGDLRWLTITLPGTSQRLINFIITTTYQHYHQQNIFPQSLSYDHQLSLPFTSWLALHFHTKPKLQMRNCSRSASISYSGRKEGEDGVWRW